MTIIYKPQNYDRHSKVELEPVLEAIRNNSTPDRFNSQKPPAIFNGIKVKVGGLRLHTFANKGVVCSACGLKATYFAIERDQAQAARNGAYHLNLYAGDGDERVIFTHDHTLARSLGGGDNPENATTMCSPCNGKKATIEQELLKRGFA